MKKIGLLLIFSCLQVSLNAYWAGCEGVKMEYELTSGYRFDSVSSRSKLYNSLPGSLSLSSHENSLKVKEISIFEIGARFRWELYDCLLVKGSLACGITNNGKYQQRGIDELNNQGHLDMSVKTGNSRDASIGFGYVFEPACGLTVAPLVGLGYDMLRISTRNHHRFSSDSIDLDRLSYTNKWNGPWIGLDAHYDYYCFQFDAGYEYHWASWHGNWKVPKNCVRQLSFGDIRQSNNAYGNVGFLRCGWNFSSCFYVGLEAKCQYWKAKSGDEYRKSNSSYSSNGSQNTDLTGVDAYNEIVDGNDNTYLIDIDTANADFIEFFDDGVGVLRVDEYTDLDLFRNKSRCAIGELKSADWQSFSITLILRNYF